jgi:hypothetical protein
MLLPVVISVLAQLPAAPVSFQSGVLTPPLVGDPGVAAVSFVKSRAMELGLDARSELVADKKLSTRFGGVVHLAQRVQGLEVQGSRVVVTFDEQQRVVMVSSSLKSFGAIALQPNLTGAEALKLATKEIEGAWLQSNGTPYGGWKKKAFVVNGALHVGFETFVPTLKNSEKWYVAVDAIDGAVLWTLNRAHANDAAKVYASSPGGLNGGVGVTPTLDTQLLNLPSDAGVLTGTRVRALNCCPTANCASDAGPARATGQTQTFQGVVDFDVAICDQQQRATNDPSVHASGDYVYAPVDPPRTAAPSINNPADFDEFAEVNAYYHFTKAYEAMRALSVRPVANAGPFSPFAMRNVGTKLPVVWVNVSDPDFNSATPNAQGVYVSNTLSRTSNALFLGHENMDALLLPPQALDSDALVIYQAAEADFAYDGPVLWHEFGHGAIYSTANWDRVVTLDARSANDETSALHEGVADLIAVMTGNAPEVGAYVGPRTQPGELNIRNVDNSFKCPDVLWGQSHNDSQHFSGAVWDGRKQFLGMDQGATFDAALYAAIVSFPADVGFERAAQIITTMVVQAFPEVTDARAKMEAAFNARGVTNCSKVLDVTNSLSTPRTYFGIPGTTFAGLVTGAVVPGPYQFKIHVPNGAKSVTATGQYPSFGNQTMARLEVMASENPITFVKTGATLANDARAKVVPTLANQVFTGKVAIDVPCGGDVYVALGNPSQRDRQLYEVSLSFEPADRCDEPVVVDAGVMQPEPPVQLPEAQEELGAPVPGCGCTSGAPFLLVPALLVFARRRRQG